MNVSPLRPFFDSNVIVYALGEQEGRTETADALLERGGVISVQVLNETAAVARRKLHMSWEHVGEALGAIRALCAPAVPLTVQIHDAARRLTAEYGFAFFDALIVAAALEARCTVLFTEDLQDGQVIDGRLTIRNPFAR